MNLRSARRRFVDAPDSLGARRRARRWKWLTDTFSDLDQMSVIDLGGTVESWRRSAVRPKHVHVVNLEDEPGDVPDWAEVDYATPARCRRGSPAGTTTSPSPTP